MAIERAYDFRGTHLPIYLEFAGEPERLLERGQRVVPFGPGLALAQPLVERVIEGEEHLANLEIGIAQDQPACIGVHAVHGRPLTGAFLRSLAVAAIVTEVATRHTYRVFREKPRGRYIGLKYSEAFEGMLGFGDGLEELRADVGQKRRSLTPKFLEEVARVYREAAARGRPPAKAVHEQLGPDTTPENARRWIARAREDGYLRKAPKEGKRGEQRGGK